MAGRPRHYQEEELILKATEVFWQKGYAAASAQDLMKAMDIGQGSFYRVFPGGKKELYQKTIKSFLANSIKVFYNKLEESENPLEFIKDFFYAIPRRTIQKKQDGCYLGNAVVELSNLDEETKLISAKQLNIMKDGFEKALNIAQSKGLLSTDYSPKLLALYLINLWNGINVTQRMYSDKKHMLDLLKLNLKILD